MNISDIADAAEWFVHAIDYPAPGHVVPPAPALVARWFAEANAEVDVVIAARDRVIYCSLFDIGKPEPPVPLIESHYHRDPVARLRRVVNFFRAYGVVQDPHHAPDHLCVELAYLAYLARLAALYPLRSDLVDAARAFARVHPGSFVPRCLPALREHDDSGNYVLLFEALARFLVEFGGDIAIPVQDESSLSPVMQAANAAIPSRDTHIGDNTAGEAACGHGP